MANPEDWAVAGPGGVALRGRLWVPPGDVQRSFVLVHGLKDHGGRYGELAEVLTTGGTAVAAFDLRGHGRSDGPRAFVRRFSDYGSDLGAEIEAVRLRFPDRPVFLFGHSLGGAVAARYALDRSGELAGLVLSAPALREPATTPKAAAVIVRFLSAIAPRARVFRPEIAGFSRIPAVLEAMANDPLIDQRPVPARTAAELLRTMPTILADAARLSSPLLVLHGTGDRITDPSGSASFVGLVGSAHRRLVTVPGAFHDLLHEPEAGQLRATIANWIQDPSATA
ncbi:MAG: lysophospholipase [Thermoplasmata archaeon]|nr:lysophospholipase [Thermoplasmata archaeon]MCI4355761.1 lysophospholipase [Thermoplasmata archaeon]